MVADSIELGAWQVHARRDRHGDLTVEVLLGGAPHATLTFPAGVAGSDPGASQRERGHRSYGDVRSRLRADMDI